MTGNEIANILVRKLIDISFQTRIFAILLPVIMQHPLCILIFL